MTERQLRSKSKTRITSCGKYKTLQFISVHMVCQPSVVGNNPTLMRAPLYWSFQHKIIILMGLGLDPFPIFPIKMWGSKYLAIGTFPCPFCFYMHGPLYLWQWGNWRPHLVILGFVDSSVFWSDPMHDVRAIWVVGLLIMVCLEEEHIKSKITIHNLQRNLC